MEEETIDEDLDIELEDEDDDEDKTDWKAEALKQQGIAKRLKTKLEKANKEPETKKETKESKELTLDWGQKAYLKASGINGKDEIELVRQWAENTGKDIEDVLENKHFKSELKDLRDDFEAKEAMPTGTKRTGNQGRDTVEYWIAKGEMPPADNFELRKQYVNAKRKRQSGGDNPFYNATR